jgi:flagellar motility protein MotE (MotC chaperone)
MLKKLNSPWIGSIAGLVAFLSVTAGTWNASTRSIQAAREAATAAAKNAAKTETPWSFDTAEIDSLVKELKNEREMVSKREKDLNELATRLNAEREELTQLTQTVFRMQKDFDLSVSHVSDEETANLKKLAKTYSGMEPEAAAGIFKQMDDASIVKIMVFIKDDQRGPILAAMSKGNETDAKRAGDLTEKLRVAVVGKKK